MFLLSCHAVYSIDLIAHEPSQKVNTVDALIHQATTVFRPGSAPRCLVIVILVAVPSDMNGAMRQLSEPAGIHRVSCLLHGNIETVLMTGTDLDTLFIAAANDFFRIFHIHRHRLFNDQIDAMINAV